MSIVVTAATGHLGNLVIDAMVTNGSIPASTAANAATIPPPPLPAISRSTDLSQFTMVCPYGDQASDRMVSDIPRSATGTSMVVLVRWMAGKRRSCGRPARKPSTTRSKLEIRPSI